MFINNILFESFDIMKINESLINHNDFLKIITSRLEDQGYDYSDIKNILNIFNKNKYFAYQNNIEGKDFIFFWSKKEGFYEFHFADLNDLDSTGDDLNELKSSQKVFSYLFSVIYRIIENKHASIRIIAPEENFKRVILYRNIIEKLIKKYSIVGYEINTYFNVVELKSKSKFTEFDRLIPTKIKNLFKRGKI